MGKASRRKQSARRAASVGNDDRGSESVFPALTGLRGVAALLVFGLHAWSLSGHPDPLPALSWVSGALRWLMAIGNSGVDLFFVLSGFLLSLPWLRAQRDGQPAPGIAVFFRRRVLRIFPAYYLQLGIFVLLAAFGLDAVNGRSLPEGGEFVAHLFLWFYAWPLVLPWLPVWWTLPVEFGFYLCLPWLVRLARPGRWPWLLLAVAVAMAWRLWLLADGPPRGADILRLEHLPGRIDQFVIGMLAAAAYTRDPAGLRAWLRRHGGALFAIAAVAFILLPALWLRLHADPTPALIRADPWLLPWHTLVALVVAAMLLAACESRAWMIRALSAPPMLWLGEISYGIYLWHYPVIDAIRRSLGAPVDVGGFWLASALALAATVAVAALSYTLLERPALRLR